MASSIMNVGNTVSGEPNQYDQIRSDEQDGSHLRLNKSDLADF